VHVLAVVLVALLLQAQGHPKCQVLQVRALQEQHQLLLLVLQVLAVQALACLQECLHATGPAQLALVVLPLRELALLTAAAAPASPSHPHSWEVEAAAQLLSHMQVVAADPQQHCNWAVEMQHLRQLALLLRHQRYRHSWVVLCSKALLQSCCYCLVQLLLRPAGQMGR
jgi:hypothetical protein